VASPASQNGKSRWRRPRALSLSVLSFSNTRLWQLVNTTSLRFKRTNISTLHAGLLVTWCVQSLAGKQRLFGRTLLHKTNSASGEISSPVYVNTKDNKNHCLGSFFPCLNDKHPPGFPIVIRHTSNLVSFNGRWRKRNNWLW
jgi:hypothetical protein